ncbi:response regulator, partial [Falsiroseomonas oryzae]|uniref:response regulator n=1 Tax=Falsiroseomonas oryzae TaxID=2766473 RepID=UPI0022EB6444
PGREILQRQLRALGADAVTAPDAAAATAALRQAASAARAFDVVLIDGHLPGTQAADLARALRQDGTLARPRVLICSSGGPIVQQAQADGLADAVLLKPVLPGRLREAVARLMAGGAASRPGDAGAATRSDAPGAGLRVLLVEDNATNQFVARAMLEAAGAQADLAVDGAAAVERAAGARFDLILMDLQMPVMDGLEATRAIRGGNGPNHATRIVGLTAAAGAEFAALARQAGMDDCVTKPFTRATLQRVLSEVRQPAGA